MKPCLRCSIPTLDHVTGEPAFNVLAVLKAFRFSHALHGVMFGENAVIERGAGKELGRGDAVHQPAEPRPARRRLGHADEQVRRAVVGVAVGAQDVALDVGALEGGHRHQAPISASKAALSWAGDIGCERSARSIIRSRSSSAAFTFAAVACP